MYRGTGGTGGTVGTEGFAGTACTSDRRGTEGTGGIRCAGVVGGTGGSVYGDGVQLLHHANKNGLLEKNYIQITNVLLIIHYLLLTPVSIFQKLDKNR